MGHSSSPERSTIPLNKKNEFHFFFTIGKWRRQWTKFDRQVCAVVDDPQLSGATRAGKRRSCETLTPTARLFTVQPFPALMFPFKGDFLWIERVIPWTEVSIRDWRLWAQVMGRAATRTALAWMLNSWHMMSCMRNTFDWNWFRLFFKKKKLGRDKDTRAAGLSWACRLTRI